MLNFWKRKPVIVPNDSQLRDLEAKGAAMSRSQAMIEFDLDGCVVDANDNFLNVLGYQRDEIVGQHTGCSCLPTSVRARNTAASGNGCAPATS